MTEPEQSPEEAVTSADEPESEPAQEAAEPQDDVGNHRVNDGL